MRWVHSRAPRVEGPVSIVRRRLYILPTRLGWGCALVMGIILLSAVNYANNMAFLLGFLIAGIGFVSLYTTHFNLLHLDVRLHEPRPVFAGETLAVEVEIHNPSQWGRWAVCATWNRRFDADAPALDLGAQERGQLRLTLQVDRRGVCPIPGFYVSSEFPFGLCHAWAWIDIEQHALVYPVPTAGQVLPPPVGGRAAGQPGTSSSVSPDDFSGARPYVIGDPLHQVDWKASARNPHLMVRQYTLPARTHQWIDWEDWPSLGTEARLSRLARALLDAESARRVYGLRLPGTCVEPAQGPEHCHACLRALALYPCQA